MPTVVQFVSMYRTSLSIEVAHSRPASAASKAVVERIWFAEVFCSNSRLLLAKKAISVMLISKISEMTKVPTPRCCFGVLMLLREGANFFMDMCLEVHRCECVLSPEGFE